MSSKNTEGLAGLVERLPNTTSLRELKVTIYTLRHIRGSHDRITLDEYVNGRIRIEGDSVTRTDKGTGLSGEEVKEGLMEASKNGNLKIGVIQSDEGYTVISSHPPYTWL